MVQIQPQAVQMLSAISATATSLWVPVMSAGRLSVMIYAGAISNGNGVFRVEVSNDPAVGGAVPYNRLTSNVANTNAQTDVRVATATLSSNTTAILFFPPGDTFAYFRIGCTVTTDGAYSAVAYVN